MSWKIFILQSIVIMLFSWATVLYFSWIQFNEPPVALENLAAEVQEINQRIDHLKQLVERLENAHPVHVIERSRQVSSGAANREKKKEAVALRRRIEALEGREKAMRKTAAVLIKEQELLFQSQKQQQPEPVRIRNWMARLPEEKQSQVRAVYLEQLDLMQNTIALEPGALPPDPEEMLTALQESREGLKQSLKDILNEAEYQKFLGSLDDETGPPAGLPLMVE